MSNERGRDGERKRDARAREREGDKERGPLKAALLRPKCLEADKQGLKALRPP
jgi:hypothetical protein